MYISIALPNTTSMKKLKQGDKVIRESIKPLDLYDVVLFKPLKSSFMGSDVKPERRGLMAARRGKGAWATCVTLAINEALPSTLQRILSRMWKQTQLQYCKPKSERNKY